MIITYIARNAIYRMCVSNKINMLPAILILHSEAVQTEEGLRVKRYSRIERINTYGGEVLT